jgi:hypothetical protein
MEYPLPRPRIKIGLTEAAVEKWGRKRKMNRTGKIFCFMALA